MDKTEYQLEVISRIRKLRIENEVSQVGLANLIDISNGQIGNIESPKFQHKYTLKQLDLIAKYFKVSIEYLLTGSNESLSSTQLIEALIKYDE